MKGGGTRAKGGLPPPVQPAPQAQDGVGGRYHGRSGGRCSNRTLTGSRHGVIIIKALKDVEQPRQDQQGSVTPCPQPRPQGPTSDSFSVYSESYRVWSVYTNQPPKMWERGYFFHLFPRKQDKM